MLRLTEVASQSVTFVRRDFIHPSSLEFTRPLLASNELSYRGQSSVDSRFPGTAVELITDSLSVRPLHAVLSGGWFPLATLSQPTHGRPQALNIQ